MKPPNLTLNPAAERPAPTQAHKATPAELKAAREFEAIFLRKMLACMEKSSKVDAKGSLSSSADAYSSMIVGALADAVAAAGGIGLGESILRSIQTPNAASSKAESSDVEPPPTSPVQGSEPRTVHGLRKDQP
jgi:Rod binding domain-containing protein